MVEVDCPKKCCNAKYCPLILAWATTVHKFQGFEAGFDSGDTINRIIADISTLDWEKINPGTAYVVASRAKTIGTHSKTTAYPQDSNLFFTGTLGAHRFTKCRFKDDGSICLMVKKRDLWVDYLGEKIEATKAKRSPQDVENATKFITNVIKNDPILDKKDLQTRIVTIIKSPSEQWKSFRRHYIL
jgi:hypothetical protein